MRIILTTVFGVLGFLLGQETYAHLLAPRVADELAQRVLEVGTPLAGALIGVIMAPATQSFFETELRVVESAIERLSPLQLAGGAIGLIVGLLVAFLAKSMLFDFLSIAGRAGSYFAIGLYIVVSLFSVYLGARVGAKQRIAALPRFGVNLSSGVPKLIDTSVVIDGRILEIVQAGFVEGPMILPRFVLRELQQIADSPDGMKRARGRRGLEVLGELQKLVPVEISDRDYGDVPAVDSKLVKLASELGAKLVTNDYNLNRVAQVEGVAVLNVNELANAVKPIVLPGEDLHVAIIRDGKEQHQGVGYLDDGTMVVVENARKMIGESAEVQVTSVLQTAAGRMVFAKPKRNGA